MTRNFHGVAIDAGSGLAASLGQARGMDAKNDDLLVFKRAILEELSPFASTVLVDAALGRDLIDGYADGCARMMAFEADVYHISDDDRITVLPEGMKVSDLPEMGVELLKFFMYYAPDDDRDLNLKKQALVAEIGRQSKAAGIQYLMEPLVYHRTLLPGSEAYALAKPNIVRKATETFADKQFLADVLKVEIPVDLEFVEGFGAPVMSRDEALTAFQECASAADGIDLVYLSAGVTFERFEASLKLAVEAGVPFQGFMCGRAIWADAVGVFGDGGQGALRAWLQTIGVERLQRLIATLG